MQSWKCCMSLRFYGWYELYVCSNESWMNKCRCFSLANDVTTYALPSLDVYVYTHPHVHTHTHTHRPSCLCEFHGLHLHLTDTMKFMRQSKSVWCAMRNYNNISVLKSANNDMIWMNYSVLCTKRIDFNFLKLPYHIHNPRQFDTHAFGSLKLSQNIQWRLLNELDTLKLDIIIFSFQRNE